MPDDRFADLEPAGRRQSAAERLSELDGEPEPAVEKPPPAPPRRVGTRYGWVVGVVALIAILVAGYNSLVNVGVGEGVSGPEPGSTLPDFAAPSVESGSDADANIAQDGSDADGVTPACEVREPEAVNICELRRRPVALTFVVPGSLGDLDCEDALDQVDRIRPDYPGVAFVGVVSGNSREELDDVLAGHDWGFPVAVDPDAAVQGLYRVGDCPVTVLARAGGEVVTTINGFPSEVELRDAVERVASANGTS